MKKTLLTLLVLAAFMPTWAQVERGASAPAASSDATGTLTVIPKVGFNYATTSMSTWESDPDVSGLVGIAAGVEAEYALQPKLGLSAAVLYSMQGRKYNEVSAISKGVVAKNKEYHHYINVPLTANYYVMEGLSVRTGLQLGYLFHQSGTVEWPQEKDYSKHSINGSPGKFDLSIPVGVSYALENGLQFDLRYNHGLTKLSWSEGLRKESNRVVQLTVGYRLDLLKLFR